MKKAVLHDGRTLTFPDSHTAGQIQEHVKGLISKEKQEKLDKEKSDSQKAKDEDKRLKDEGSRHEKQLKISESNGKSLSGMKDEIARLAMMISKTFDGIGDEMRNLSKSVDGLHKSLETSTSVLVKTMKTPRKLVTNQRGKPIGVRLEDDDGA